MGSKNPFRNLRIEFHILQSFPVTCLNRDDVGAPKTATVGGVTRARVSSQCWKRQVRMALKEQGLRIGQRTRLIRSLIEEECLRQGASPEQASTCGIRVEQSFIKGGKRETKGKKKSTTSEEIDGQVDLMDASNASGEEEEKTDTLLFLSPSEVSRLVRVFAEKGFDPDQVITQKDSKKQAKEIAEIIGQPNYAVDGLDIALFGRMVAQAASMNVEAACSFSHAISTHKVTNEVEFFTAMDDHSDAPAGSAHMGSLEFNSATYYRYVCLDVGQLWQSLAGCGVEEAIEAFVKALYLAVPSARQSTQAGYSTWEFARVYVRRGQNLQVPFEAPVKAREGGFLEPSKQELCSYLDKKKKLAGMQFGELAEYDFGEKEDFSIDKLIEAIKEKIGETSL